MQRIGNVSNWVVISFLANVIAGDVTAQTEQRQSQMQLPSVRFPAGKNVVEVPFEVESGWMVIPVKVNGSRPLRYVLDSGATGAVHNNAEVVDSLNLKITGTIQGGGAGGAAQPSRSPSRKR